MTTAVDRSRVLVVDDEPQLANALRNVLSTEGYRVQTVDEGRIALACLSEFSPELVITDMLMAPMNGIELCRRIRAASNVPIIMLSGESGERTKVEALDSGADDYVVKPFATDELLARVRAVLRRGTGASGVSVDASGSLEIGDFRIDFDSRRVYVRDRLVRLTPKEFALFTCMARSPGRVLPQRTLLHAVWGHLGAGHPEYLRVYIRQLRCKLEEQPSRPVHVITERWIGYRFDAGPATDEQ